MRRSIGLLILSVCCGISACSQGGGTGEPDGASISVSSLEGEWDTGPYPADKLREAIIAAGYTDAEVDEVLDDFNSYEVRLSFQGDIAVSTGWDPTDSTQGPTGGDHGPYVLLPGNKLKITCVGCDVDTKYLLYSYDVEGTTLTLGYIRDVDPDYTAHDRHMALAYATANTSLPFQKVG